MGAGPKRQRDIPLHKPTSWPMENLRSFPWGSPAAPEFDEDGYEIAKGITLTKETTLVPIPAKSAGFGKLTPTNKVCVLQIFLYVIQLSSTESCSILL